ncbi:unnamed protein product [Mesocestoides corti]|uniref:NR LBD domain-containing protein n=1 Tax=Mesocestoides corti TaxID=53468 RepID=A0A158QS32_MESCO|nr:unnamed protein product [Mesocestoides corti]
MESRARARVLPPLPPPARVLLSVLAPEKLEQRAKPKRRKQHLASDDGDVKVGVGGGSSGGGLVPFSHSSSANPFSSSASSSSTLHHQSPRMPAPQFGGDAHELMATRTLNSLIAAAAAASDASSAREMALFTDMAGSRSVQSQFMSLSGFSDPQAAAAAAAVKFHLAMTSSTAANSNRLEANNANEAFDPTLHHRLPPPPTQFPSEGAFVPEASSAGPFLDGRLPRPNWQQPIPPTTTLSEVAKPLDVGLLSKNLIYISSIVAYRPPSVGGEHLSATLLTALQRIPIPFKRSRNSAIESGLPRPRQCRYQDFQTLCYHSTCRRAMLKQQRRLLQSEYLPPSLELDRPDEHLFACLTECVQRIREPFAPEEPLDTRAAETLEQEYNRMDVCIRRIIRVVKMLPYFNEIGKPAQLGLLRVRRRMYSILSLSGGVTLAVMRFIHSFFKANVYGMIVLYSSFFFERDIRKLRYPIKRQDGTLSTVTVSMLDDLTPSMGGCIGDKALATSAFLLCKNRQAVATGLREDFELYKVRWMPLTTFHLLLCCLVSPSTSCDRGRNVSPQLVFLLLQANTLAAFNHLDELAGEDDLLRMVLLAVKLFTDDSLSEDLRSAVELSKRAYLVFLWTYLRWRAGPKHLRQATELFARLHLAFIDLRSLEIRMTEFAKLVSLDGLSPLMREICSLRSNSSGRGLVGGAL